MPNHDLPEELERELAQVAGESDHRYQAVLRLAAAAQGSGMKREVAFRRALDETARVDAEVEAQMAARLQETVTAGPEEFVIHERPPRRRGRT